MQRIEDVGVAKLFKEENSEFAENLRYKSESVQRTIQLFQQTINLYRNIDVKLESKIILLQFFDAPNSWSLFLSENCSGPLILEAIKNWPPSMVKSYLFEKNAG